MCFVLIGVIARNPGNKEPGGAARGAGNASVPFRNQSRRRPTNFSCSTRIPTARNALRAAATGRNSRTTRCEEGAAAAASADAGVPEDAAGPGGSASPTLMRRVMLRRRPPDRTALSVLHRGWKRVPQIPHSQLLPTTRNPQTHPPQAAHHHAVAEARPAAAPAAAPLRPSAISELAGSPPAESRPGAGQTPPPADTGGRTTPLGKTVHAAEGFYEHWDNAYARVSLPDDSSWLETLRRCRAEGSQFTDDAFPADERSLFLDPQAQRQSPCWELFRDVAGWKRLGDLWPDRYAAAAAAAAAAAVATLPPGQPLLPLLCCRLCCRRRLRCLSSPRHTHTRIRTRACTGHADCTGASTRCWRRTMTGPETPRRSASYPPRRSILVLYA